MRKLIVIIAAVAVAVVGGSWFYIKVIEGDPPAKLNIDSASDADVTSTTAAVGCCVIPIASSTSS